ncbi:MAG: hypothetical protein ACNA71_05425 [Kiritimatiellia bacterium]
MPAQEWSIQSRGNACQVCQRTFHDGEECISALFPDPPGFLRGDFCQACWEQRETHQTAPFSVWKTVYALPPAAPVEALRKETAESLLRRMLEEDQHEQIPVIYILALMLERKKILVEKDVTVDDDNTVRRIYEHRKTGEMFVITDPRLQVDGLESVQQQVAAMLGAQPQATDSPVSPENVENQELDHEEQDANQNS